MSGFCPHDWHGTTDADLQQMSWGEDYYYFSDVQQSMDKSFSMRAGAAYRAERRREYAIHDEAIAQAKREGLVFHLLPDAEQWRLMDEAAAALHRTDPDKRGGSEG